MFDPFADEEGAEPPPRPPFPRPITALLLTFGASLASFVIAIVLFEEPDVAALGVGEALGVGGVATLAARRVPEPQAERLGLRGFSPRFLPMLLCLVPLVFLASEFDNWGRDLDDMLPDWVPAEALITEAPDTAAEEAPAADAPGEAASDATPAGEDGDAKQDEQADPEEVARTIARDEAPDDAARPLFEDPPTGWALAQIAIVTVGIAPVVEGFLFFGVILQGLVTLLGRPRGLILTGCLYAMIHLVGQVGLDAGPAQSVAGLLSLISMGAALGVCRLATGSVLAPILVATGFIGIQLFALVAPDVLAVPGFNVELDAHTPATVLLPSLASVAWGLWLLSRQPMELLPPR